jgi:hypothetical protein
MGFRIEVSQKYHHRIEKYMGDGCHGILNTQEEQLSHSNAKVSFHLLVLPL